MTDDLNPGRWAGFTDGERELIRHGLRENIAQICADAAQDTIPKADLRGAAGTLLLAQRMDLELDEAEGLEHPSLDVATIELIASGEYAAAVREMLAEGAPS